MSNQPDVSVVIPLYNNERYIPAALDSALNQGVSNIEILVIDDGSTDGGAAIVADYAEKHPEIKLVRQQNQGVSAARNKALDLATGTYVAFLDSDDALRPGALADMIRIANYWRADLVVGESRSVYTFGTMRQWHTVALSKKQVIERDDPDLIYNFGNWNKLYRRSVIEEHGLRYKPLKHCEDGLFLYEFLNHCGIITGCPRWVYEYHNRMVIDARSALKSLSSSTFADVTVVVDSILAATASWSETFRHEMTIRLLRGLVIDECYRRLWTNSDELCETIAAYIEDFKRRIGSDSWKEIVEAEADLCLSEGLLSKEQIASRPLVSIVVLHHMPNEAYREFITTLYWQLAPNFEVLVPDVYESSTPAEVIALPNLSFYTSATPLVETLNRCKGTYVQLVYEGCVYDDGTLRTMINYARRDDSDFVSVPPKGYRDGKAFPLEGLETVFEQKAINLCLSDPALNADCAAKDTLLSNKLFIRKALLELLETDASDEVSRLISSAYKSLSSQRHSGGAIGITTDAEPSIEPAEKAARTTARESTPSAADNQALRLRGMSYAFWSHAAPVDTKHVLFLSDMRDSIGGDFQPLQPEFETRGYKVTQVFTLTKRISHSRKDQLRFGKNLASAGIIIVEGTHEAIRGLRIRKGQKLVQLQRAGGAVRMIQSRNRSVSEESNVMGLRQETAADPRSSDVLRSLTAGTHNNRFEVSATGIPRTDAFFERGCAERLRSEYDKKYPQLAGKKIVLVAPTYRGRTPAVANFSYDKLELTQLHERLGDDYVFILKWPPALASRIERRKQSGKGWDTWKGWESYPEEMRQLSDYVVDLSTRYDINDLLMIADTLVTDYSSDIFEFVLTGRPIVYFWYDLNDFLLDRGANCDMNEFVYGAVAYDSEDLADTVAAGGLYKDKRAAFTNRFMNACDGHSTERTVDWILN